MTYDNEKLDIQVNIGIPMGCGGDSMDMDAFLEEHPAWAQAHITARNIIKLRNEFSAWYKQVAPEEWVAPEEARVWAILRPR